MIARQPQGRRQIRDPGKRFGGHSLHVLVQEPGAQPGRAAGIACFDETGQIDQGFMDRAIDSGGVVEDHGGFLIHPLGRQDLAAADKAVARDSSHSGRGSRLTS